MRYCFYYRHPGTKNEMTQCYAVNCDEVEIPLNIRTRRQPKSLPTAWDDLARSDRKMRNWKFYRRTQWK